MRNTKRNVTLSNQLVKYDIERSGLRYHQRAKPMQEKDSARNMGYVAA